LPQEWVANTHAHAKVYVTRNGAPAVQEEGEIMKRVVFRVIHHFCGHRSHSDSHYWTIQDTMESGLIRMADARYRVHGFPFQIKDVLRLHFRSARARAAVDTIFE
jgi:hypothetical protein